MLKHFLLNVKSCTFERFLFHMKIFIYTLLALALALLVYNITLVDFNKLSIQDSMIAIIGIVSALCAILILLIFRTSKRIEEKLKEK
jgi:hypothetical protein